MHCWGPGAGRVGEAARVTLKSRVKENCDPDLPGGGGVGPLCHGGAGGLDKKEVVIQQGPSSLDTARVKVVVEAAYVGVPEGGAMQEAGGTTVQPGKPAFVVTGVWD